MKKSFKKLLAKASLLSVLSLAPVAKATKTEFSSNDSNSNNSYVERINRVNEGGDGSKPVGIQLEPNKKADEIINKDFDNNKINNESPVDKGREINLVVGLRASLAAHSAYCSFSNFKSAITGKTENGNQITTDGRVVNALFGLVWVGLAWYHGSKVANEASKKH